MQFMNEQTYGPSLLDLQLRAKSTIEQVSWLLSAKSFGAVVGGLVLGK
jgi:hypothetical protein